MKEGACKNRSEPAALRLERGLHKAGLRMIFRDRINVFMMERMRFRAGAKPKTEAGIRSGPLLSALADVLPDKKHRYILWADGGKSPLPGWKLEDLYVGYKMRTGGAVSSHEIRCGYASARYEPGVDYKTVQQLLSHAQLDAKF